MEKLKGLEYKLDDIVESQVSSNKCIGKYKKKDVVLKKGKYGNYVEWGDSEKKSLTGLQKELDEITLDDIIPLIENKTSLNQSVIRTINSDISIRSGKYGNYIFYKTHNMNKPKFIKLAGFKGNYNTCPEDEIEQYVANSK